MHILCRLIILCVIYAANVVMFTNKYVKPCSYQWNFTKWSVQNQVDSLPKSNYCFVKLLSRDLLPPASRESCAPNRLTSSAPRVAQCAFTMLARAPTAHSFRRNCTRSFVVPLLSTRGPIGQPSYSKYKIYANFCKSARERIESDTETTRSKRDVWSISKLKLTNHVPKLGGCTWTGPEMRYLSTHDDSLTAFYQVVIGVGGQLVQATKRKNAYGFSRWLRKTGRANWQFRKQTYLHMTFCPV